MSRIGTNKSNIGIIGEESAKKWLLSKGYTIVTQNFKTYHSEIDIIMNKDDTTYFTEVKAVTVSHGTIGSYNPEDNFTYSKFIKMNKAIEYYLLSNPSIEKYETLLLCVFVDTIKKTARIRIYENPCI